MSLPPVLSLRGADACRAACPPAARNAADSSVMYRSPGNDYKNTITARKREARCKRIEGAPVTIIQMTSRRAATRGPQPAAADGRVDPVAQRARDSDARRILETELKAEEDKLAVMQKEFNNGQPERQGDEKNFQKYLDRVNDMRAAIARKQTDIAALQREIKKLPPPLPQ